MSTLVFTKLQFDVYNAADGTDTFVDLPVWGASPTDRFILKSVDGLGPPEMSLQYPESVSDGYSFLTGRQLARRQIVMRIGLNPNRAIGQTAGDLRNILYALLSGPRYVQPILNLVNGTTTVAYVQVSVSKFETVPWSKDPEVQITFETAGPYLTGSPQQVVTPTTSSFTVTNPGTAESGFSFQVTLTANMSSFTLSCPAGLIKVTYPFLSGDRIAINTVPGTRDVTVTRSGAVTHLFNALSNGSNWFGFLAGANPTTISTANFNSGSISFYPLYWGI